jgi:hypothetical protein
LSGSNFWESDYEPDKGQSGHPLPNPKISPQLTHFNNFSRMSPTGSIVSLVPVTLDAILGILDPSKLNFSPYSTAAAGIEASSEHNDGDRRVKFVPNAGLYDMNERETAANLKTSGNTAPPKLR